MDFFGNLGTSVRVGRLAAVNSDGGQTGIEIEFSPSFELVRTGSRASASLLYGLRVGSNWGSVGTESFLLFHQLTVAQRLTISRRLLWNASGSANYGKMDFGRSLFLFDSNIGDKETSSLATGRPESQVVQYLSYSANSGVTVVLNPKQRLVLGGAYSATRQLSGNPPESAIPDTSAEPTSKTVSANVTLSTRMSSSGTMSASITGALSMFPNDLTSWPVTALLGWDRQARENLSFSVQAGSVFLFQTYTDTARSDDPEKSKYYLSVLPAGGMSLSVRPVWNTITRWQFSTFLSLSTYVDTVRAAVLPRMNTGFVAVSIMTPKVQFRLSVSAATILFDEVRGEPLDDNEFPAAAALSAQFSFELKRSMFLRVGGQANTALSYLFNGPIETGSQELVGTVSFVMQFDPNHTGASE